MALATLPFFQRFGLVIHWSTFLPSIMAMTVAAIGWMAHFSRPGRPSEWPIAESLVVFVLIALCCCVVTPAQYLAVALKRPLADAWLAHADSLVGISVPEAVLWTKSHPRFASILLLSYISLMPQFVAPIVVLGLYYRDRDALWEYAFNFHVCLVVTLIGLALFPAMCAFTYYGFESPIDQTGFIRDFNALRNGTFTDVRLGDLEGLITFPSFHVAGAMMVTWAFRNYPRMFVLLVVLNGLMIGSTVLLGPHYAVDILASLVVFATSAWVYRLWARNLVKARDPQVKTVDRRTSNALSR
ncbi:MAG: phosphatase PAP2 family protein [Vicinamibacterales bacterium]